jgi:hypothetical protein
MHLPTFWCDGESSFCIVKFRDGVGTKQGLSLKSKSHSGNLIELKKQTKNSNVVLKMSIRSDVPIGGPRHQLNTLYLCMRLSTCIQPYPLVSPSSGPLHSPHIRVCTAAACSSVTTSSRCSPPCPTDRHPLSPPRSSVTAATLPLSGHLLTPAFSTTPAVFSTVAAFSIKATCHTAAPRHRALHRRVFIRPR